MKTITIDHQHENLVTLFDRIRTAGQISKQRMNNAGTYEDYQEQNRNREAITAMYKRTLSLYDSFINSDAWKTACTLSPEALAKTRTARLRFAGREKAHKMGTDHRAPVVGKIPFSDLLYCQAKHIVHGKINSATKRGVTPEHNVYMKYYPDMVHTAQIAIESNYLDAERIASLQPTVAWIDPDHDQIVTDVLFSEGWKACGRFAYNIEKRANVEAPDQAIRNRTGKQHTSGGKQEKRIVNQEERIVTAVTMQQFLQDAFKLIDTLHDAKGIGNVQATNYKKLLQGRTDGIDKPSVARKALERILIAGGLIEKDARGNIHII